MAFLSRVVWSEGMHLGPQHFQAQCRYFEDSLQFSAAALTFQPYGFLGLEVDLETLRNGTVSVTHARGVLRDGLMFQMPGPDAVVAPRAIRDVMGPANQMMLYLGITRREFLANRNGHQERYVRVRRTLPDETTGRDEQPIELGQKNFRILTEAEAVSGWECLPLIRVMRDGSGNFLPDPEFIPPLLQINANEMLMVMCKQLLEVLAEKRNALSPEVSATAEPSPRELLLVWYLHAINSGATVLQHLWKSRRGHPELLFLELSRLAGALSTFSLRANLADLPPYDHEDLYGSFSRLNEFIRAQLEFMIPTNCLRIDLAPSDGYIWEGTVQDRRCFDRAQWILAISSSTSAFELVSRVPALVKVCSRRFVGELVRRALPGVTLSHVTSPPPSVPRRADMQCFVLSRSGPFWDDIVQTSALGVYVPGDLPKAELELYVVLGS